MDQRKAVRQRAYMPGRIAFARGSQVRDCSIRDISDTGARLIFTNPRAIPEKFELLIVATGELFQAQARWRRGREIGVFFVARDEFLSWPTAARPPVTEGSAA